MHVPVSSASVARAACYLTVVVLIVPMAIVTVALTPAFIICPFLSERHQRLVQRLLTGLRQWTQVIAEVLRRDTS